jgi:hypothetical protein
VWFDIASFAGLVVIVAALYWLAFRIEPHHSSQNGHRFLATAQSLGPADIPQGRFMEVRGLILDDAAHIEITRRIGFRRQSARYRVVARGPAVSRRRSVYLLESSDGGRLGLRLPPSSDTSRLIEEALSQH